MKYLVAAAFAIAQIFGAQSQEPCPSLQTFNFSTSQCIDVPDRNLCETPTAAPLVTSPIAEFLVNESSLVNNIFTFKIRSSPVVGRIINSIGIHDTFNTDLNPTCSYPGSNYTRSYSTSPCFDNFEGKLSFQELVSCGLAKTFDNITHSEYSGYISLSGKDFVGMLRTLEVYRTTTSRLKLSIKLPKSIQITLSNITVISPISILAAVTHQEYDPVADKAKIIITTSVQYPYKLSNATANTAPIPGIYQIDQCRSTDLGQACEQEITLEISNITNFRCDFSGNYTIDLMYACNPTFSNCPVTDSSIANAISFNLQSGNICPTLSIDSQIQGKIEASVDESYRTITSVFAAEDVGYFRITLTSGVTIESISISSLFVNEKNINTQRDNQGYQFISASGGVFDFNLQLSVGDSGSGKLFESNNTDEIFTFQVSATVQITYLTTFKRDVQTETHKFSQQFFLDTTKAAESITHSLPEESSSAVIIPAAAIIAGGIAIANF